MSDTDMSIGPEEVAAYLRLLDLAADLAIEILGDDAIASDLWRHRDRLAVTHGIATIAYVRWRQ